MEYNRLLRETSRALDSLDTYYPKAQIDSMQFYLGEKGRLLTATYSLESKQKGIDFNVAECDNLALMGDEDKLIQIGSNLLANAVKFTDEGSVSLSVSHHNDMLTLIISDTGYGIAQEEQQKIFEPFKQLGNARATAKDEQPFLVMSRYGDYSTVQTAINSGVAKFVDKRNLDEQLIPFITEQLEKLKPLAFLSVLPSAQLLK